ncbi:MAG: hypothetical protein OER86_03885 [Phycisphaerae bacterium]|nr:hypothetical protein [Phycisphaerae bacterium]
MNRNSLRGLLVLNVVLLVALAVVSIAPPPALAQNRRAGDYIMVAGQAQGTVANVIYITDLNNQAMLAVTYDRNRGGGLRTVGYRDMKIDFNIGERR